MTCSYCNIKDLTLNASSFFINALIIAKTEKKIFSNQYNGGVITFTVRDTKDHFINCSVWGDEKFIENSNRAYKLGGVISIYNPKVKQKNNNSVYYPRTTSPFELTVNESKACIHRVTDELEVLLSLRNRAIKPTHFALKLDDLKSLRYGSDPREVDLVVLVRGVGPVSEVQTKSGAKNVRKVYLMDTTMESISMTVWHNEYQERMEDWEPLKTVLQLVDVHAKYSDFEQSPALTVISKTIIVENPVESSRSNDILAYIHGLSPEKMAELKSIQVKRLISAASITEVMSVKHILDEITQGGAKVVAAIVYAVITKFEISSASTKTCANCKRFLFGYSAECANAACAEKEFNGPKQIDRFFMKVSLADHSGTLNCHITDNHGQKILGHTAQELKKMSEEYLYEIYDRFNLERSAVKVVVKPTSETKYFAEIVSIDVEEPDVMAMAIKL